MKQEELSKLTDQELLAEKKKLNSTSIINAVLIGFMIGVIIFSVWKNTWGLVTLIPVFIIYKLVQNSKKDKPLEQELKARNLK